MALLGLGATQLAADDSARTESVAGEANTPVRLTGSKPQVPEPPTDPVAAKSYSVFERHCARCHHAGRLQHPPADETFANILALDEIARDPALVRPSLPDASALYTAMVRRAMPPDVFPDDNSTRAAPSPEEIQAVRDWIAGLPVGSPDLVRSGTTPHSAAIASGPTPGQPRALHLVIRSDKDVYASGDLVTFFARANADCHLTLIGVDGAGTAIVLFPNEFEQDNLLPAGREMRVPGERAPYQFRAKAKGREIVIGVCTVGAKIADGIRQDYGRQRFTTLGDWRVFLSRALAGEADEPLGRGRPKVRTQGKARLATPLRPEHHARTAISYEVQ